MERPHVPEASQFRFRVRLRTRWCDEDNQQVLNNAVYLTLFEEARLAYFTQLGFLRANQFPFLLAQTNVVFVALGRGGVEVDLEARTTSLGTTSFTQSYRVLDAARGTVWAQAEARLVIYDPGSGAKRAMEPAFRAAIAGFEGLD
ncbi:MAG: acyl-CoA thioesterase [Planctomycetes bacterium]|nr:acyl-CoA thioesterase [Planctomycetota bacterium]